MKFQVPKRNLIAVEKFKYERMFAIGFSSSSIPLWHARKEVEVFFLQYCCTESLWYTFVLFVAGFFLSCTESLQQTEKIMWEKIYKTVSSSPLMFALNTGPNPGQQGRHVIILQTGFTMVYYNLNQKNIFKKKHLIFVVNVLLTLHLSYEMPFYYNL